MPATNAERPDSSGLWIVRRGAGDRTPMSLAGAPIGRCHPGQSPSACPALPGRDVVGPDPSQDRQEHRVGSVPVRPELHRRAGAETGHAVGQQRPRVDELDRDRGSARRLGHRHLRSRPGAASRSRRRRRRPAGPPGAPQPSSSRCSRVSGGRSAGVRRHRASGRRRSAPRPVHGASTSTRSKSPSGKLR